MRPQVFVLVLVASLAVMMQAVAGQAGNSDDPNAVKQLLGFVPFGSNLFSNSKGLQGLDTDVNDMYSSLMGTGLANGLGSGYQMINQNMRKQYQAMQEAMARLQQASQEEIMRAVEWLQDPERACQSMRQTGFGLVNGLQKQLEQTGQSAGSMLSRLPFGRK